MRTRSFVSSAVVVLALATSATAQSPEPAPVRQSPAPQSTSAPSHEQYGLNLNRIQKGLKKSAEREDFEGLNLKYYVNVYAPAPTIKLFTPLDDLLHGQAPY